MKRTFSLRLLLNFIVSTLVPFTIVTLVVVYTFINQYLADTQALVNSSATAISNHIVSYVEELEQLSLMPYYNDDFYYYLQSKAWGQHTDNVRMVNSARGLDAYMTFVRNTRKDIAGIFMVTEDDCLYYTVANTDRMVLDNNFAYMNEVWYEEAVAADGRAILVEPHHPAYLQPGYERPVLSVVRAIVRLQDRQLVCVNKIDIDVGIFDSLLADISFPYTSEILITGETGNGIYSAQGHSLGLPPLGNSTTEYKGEKWQVFSHAIDAYGWTLHVLLSDTEIQARTNIIYVSAVLFYAIGLLAAVIFYRLLSKRMVRSVEHIKTIFRHITMGDLTRRYTYTSNTELDALGASLNQTITRLDEHIQREYVMAMKQKDITFKALQSQIQPHFLFNTLNSFAALNQIGEKEALDESLHALSEMMRYVLYSPPIVTLQDELDFIRDYCTLQKLRFSERFMWSITCTIDAKKHAIPMLVLQPIVENSLIHGVEPADKVVMVSIAAFSVPGGFCIVIKDDGPGFAASDKANKGVGLENIRKRLEIFAHTELQLESKPGKGVTTTITILEERGGTLA